MKTTKKIAAVCAALMASVLAFGVTGGKEKSGVAAADGLAKEQAKLLKEKPAPEADFEFRLTEDLNGVVLTKYKGKAKNVVIPATIEGLPVVMLGKESFYEAQVTSVVIPEGVEAIGRSAFAHSSVKTVVLPSTLKAICYEAFRSAESLRSINLLEGLVGIDGYAFCEAGITSITLPKSLKYLAFQDINSLEEINIPEGISAGNGDSSACPDFSRLFGGDKISKNVALQKKLRDIKVAPDEECKRIRESLKKYFDEEL